MATMKNQQDQETATDILHKYTTCIQQVEESIPVQSGISMEQPLPYTGAIPDGWIFDQWTNEAGEDVYQWSLS